jgi:hypothetical protein
MPLLIQQSHPLPHLQPALLAAHPAISSTSSPATCSSSPGTNLNYPTHTLASCSSGNLIYLLTCKQINFFYVEGTKKVCPPTFTTTYPFRSQSISNLTNSFSIPVGMDEYSITHFLLLIRSPAAILNSPINLCLPLDTALVGRRFSFNFS